MDAKTQQLQIRVSPAEKAALRRLADQAGLSVSAFVLQRALPRGHEGVSQRIRGLGGGKKIVKALSDLVLYLQHLSPEEFESAVTAPDLETLSGLQLNCAAAAVEQESWRRGLVAPEWAAAVPPLQEPYFAWALRSLRPHLMRIAPAPFKRRGVYIPGAGDPRQ